ncbi:hypothetical protein [Photobacterium sanguinicancri]|uniref:Uncharacterized protein n=1 Tax=Photobacterium sanguinicancri TaxID=875932 RepID=A0ABX4FWQ9_9GAMM|nr:hypothetical protein [Photobacterium sanguinicancri]OZS43316.1 hypothetical protein ASV53_13820 [Photobacterium sanguinicancri]
MTQPRKTRQNLTNYDVVELLRSEIEQSEKKMSSKLFFAHAVNVLLLALFIMFYVSTESQKVRNYAAEAMQKSFEAERAVHIIDEAAGTNFLEQSKIGE